MKHKRTRAARGITRSRPAAERQPIVVPRVPPAAFDDTRPPSALLAAQLEHLQWAALPASMRAPGILPKPEVKTEGEAAQRIGELTTAILAVNAPKSATRRRTAKNAARRKARRVSRVAPAKRRK